jgi:hypothetical protein
MYLLAVLQNILLLKLYLLVETVLESSLILPSLGKMGDRDRPER